MTFLRNLMLLASLLGTATIARAQEDDTEIHSLRYCNEMTFGVAVSAKLPGGWFGSDKWETSGFYDIKPGDCKTVYSHESFQGSRFNRVNPTLHVAFAFTDSTGVGVMPICSSRTYPATHGGNEFEAASGLGGEMREIKDAISRAMTT